MKIYYYCFLSLIILIACSREKKEVRIPDHSQLQVYLVSNYLTTENYQNAFELFNPSTNCNLDLKIFRDGQELVDCYLNEKDSLNFVDVLVGIDNVLAADLEEEEILTEYKSDSKQKLKEDLFLTRFPEFIPLAYSYLAFIYNREETASPPLTFGIMQDGIWKEKLIIFDPESSSLGRAMLFWSVSAFGENGYGHFWRSIKENIFQVCPSFNEGYSMFLAQEAPLVLAFLTTPIYHRRENITNKMSSVIPSEGSFRYVYGAGICKKSDNKELAGEFIDFLISNSFQVFIPYSLWLYPANIEVELPPEFNRLDLPKNDITDHLSLKSIKRGKRRWLKRWKEIIRN